jgi:hypothetical protein
MRGPHENTKALDKMIMKNQTTKPLVRLEPKTQIHTMLTGLRREREKMRALLCLLESKLSPVLRPPPYRVVLTPARIDDAAPLAEQLQELVFLFHEFNEIITDLTSRAEV